MIDREVTRFGAQREEASKIRLIFTYHHCSVQSHLCMLCVLCVLCVVCVVCCVLCVVCCVLCVRVCCMLKPRLMHVMLRKKTHAI